MKYKFRDLLQLRQQNKIRTGDILVVKRFDNAEDFEDYYIVDEKDIKWLLGEKMCLFDNFYIFELDDNYYFSIIYRQKEKDKLIKTLKEEGMLG